TKEQTLGLFLTPPTRSSELDDDAGDATAALRDLRAAGFTAEEVELLTDEKGEQQIDLTGEGREVLVHIIRSTQQPQDYYDAPRIVRQIEQELKAVMIGNASQRFDAEGNLTDAATKEFIRQLLQNLVEWTRRIGQPQK